MKRKFKGGLTSVSLPVFIADTSSTTGGGLSGVTSASSGLVLEYRRTGQSSWTSVTPTAGKTLGTYLSGGIVADGSLAGAYEVDFPDAAFASGARMVLCRIRGVTNMLPVLIEIELDAVDYQDATAFGLSRIDAAVSSRSSQTSVDTLAGYVDTEVAAIKAKTDNLPVDPADASDIAASFATVNSTLSTISGYIDTEVAAIKAKTDNLPANPAAVSDIPTANAVASAVAATQALSRLDSMIESDGAGQFRFDTIALSMGAGGGGGTDWTANERTAIRSILGIPTSGTTPTDPTVGILDEIRDKTALITTGTIQSSIPVTSSGQIDIPLIIGDDYLAANGRAFIWTVPLPTGFAVGSASCRFGMANAAGTGEEFVVTGTVTDAGAGNITLTFDVSRAVTSALSQGSYTWSVEVVSSGGAEITQVASDKQRPAQWRKKQT